MMNLRLLTCLLQISTVLISASPSLTQIDGIMDNNDEHRWNYKFAFTKSVNSQLVIECEQSDQIWIGWSHYGTRHTTSGAVPSGSATKSSDFAIQDSMSASIKNSPQFLNL